MRNNKPKQILQHQQNQTRDARISSRGETRVYNELEAVHLGIHHEHSKQALVPVPVDAALDDEVEDHGVQDAACA